MEPDEVRLHIIEVVEKTKPKMNQATVTTLVDAMLDGLRRRGIAVVDEGDMISEPDEHLKTLKHIRRTLRDAVDDTDSKRDLASLTRRLQDVSREVTIIEERHRAEQEQAQRGKSGNGSKNSGATASAGTGSLDI
jgi:hypothetical protein